MSAIAEEITHTVPVTEMVKATDRTSSWDHVLLHRIRDRLAARGLLFELHAEKAGWRWSITGRDDLRWRVFGSLHLALQHADTYTSVWYQAPHPAPAPSG